MFGNCILKAAYLSALFLNVVSVPDRILFKKIRRCHGQMLLVMVTGVEGAKASEVTAGAHLQSLKLQVLEQSGGEASSQDGSLIRTFPKKHLDFSEA